MALQEQSGGSGSNKVLSKCNRSSLDVGPHAVKGVQLKEQFLSGSDYALKVRKPYTITKQRERWTEEEHKKFIEALKLYGRAWRKIEEHVGTKTAVQIRSHAQKFFSKVVRESSNTDADSVKPIEIPPPRPKRKPAHPYPRKLVDPQKSGIPVTEQPRRSTSPNLSMSENEDQSPISVLSAIESDMMGGTDSNSPDGSPSPVSSPAGVNQSGFLISEPDLPQEGTGSSLQLQLPASSAPDEQTLVQKLELFPQDGAFVKEGSAEVASTRSLKLFGKTVLIRDSQSLFSPITGACKSAPSDINDQRSVDTLQWNLMPAEIGDGKIYPVQFPNETSNLAGGVSAAPLPWCAFYGSMPFSCLPLHKPVPTKAHQSSVGEQTQDGEVQEGRSWTGSNTGSLYAGGDGDRNWEVETSQQLACDTEKVSHTKKRDNPEKSRKGFLPYKRCLAERETQSEEREGQRVRLCL